MLKEYTPEEAKKIREVELFDDRNIRDDFKGMSHEDIINNMPKNNLVAVCSNRIRDFNWGTVVRNANAFGLDRVIFTGKRRYDRRGTVGAHHYSTVEYNEDIFNVIQEYKDKGYRIVAAEYDERYVMNNLYEYSWDENTVLIFGEEGITLDDEILQECDDIVMIPMWGTVRSINVGTASGVMFSHFATQHTPMS